MIVSYLDQTTRDIHFGDDTKDARRIPKNLWPVCHRRLAQLHAATQLSDLKSPGNHLEKLKKNLAGWWSVRVNAQWRVIFQFDKGEASKVGIVDYH